ncbi:aspartyl/asparaginyl beta-hydroxylase domain-containing protein [Corallococcus llansteffanensis]|uniref:Aspartyl/asparaginy/proline hydroxylase domain-containing protein n=1 Tax=Corallococcus llansteffanensis TaxID=2316731 RepID=A0A3A8QBB2_9BACT|nr:aspartyl/asparaginyl beta-hydroxylase domain-containing protein [Corallococcus llansteffanensis]RKH65886.1 hypothetical protein D7V93_05200 [Corallococcus llansteffanensis]
MHAVRLNRSFDAHALEAAYEAVRAQVEGRPAGYPGEGHVGWSSICLDSVSSGPSPVLARAPALRELLSGLGLRLRLARLLRLEPGGVIREHHDAFLSRRIVRLHVPIVTHPDVEFYLGGQRCPWGAGELWYGDFSQPHHGINRSAIARVHLVLDVSADAALLRLFPEGLVPASLAALEPDGAREELDPGVLDRLAFDFTLPAGFHLPGTGLEALTAPLPGSVRLVDNELCVFVNEQPFLKAVPVSEDTVDLLGMGPEARLRYTFHGDQVRGVTLTLGTTPVHSFDVRHALRPHP